MLRDSSQTLEVKVSASFVIMILNSSITLMLEILVMEVAHPRGKG